MSRTNTEKLNSLKVGDCLCEAGIDYLKFQNLGRIGLDWNYSPILMENPTPKEFSVLYTSVDYVLINWAVGYTYLLSNVQ